jgi:hypothetical protein
MTSFSHPSAGSMSRAFCIICFSLDTLFTGGMEHETRIFNLQPLRQPCGGDPGSGRSDLLLR